MQNSTCPTKKFRYSSRGEAEADRIMRKWDRDDEIHDCKYCNGFHRTSHVANTISNARSVLRHKVLEREIPTLYDFPNDCETVHDYTIWEENKAVGKYYVFLYNYKNDYIYIMERKNAIRLAKGE